MRPTIVVFNHAKTPLGFDLAKFVPALQRYANLVDAAWACPAKLVLGRGFRKGCWALAFLDDSDDAGAMAYHDLTPDGLPMSKVFVRTIAKAGCSLTVAASHELAEMLGDPAVNLMCTGPDSRAFYSVELCDPCEADEQGFRCGGFLMSDFVTPAYFEGFHRPGSARFDHCGHISRPFEILEGGYQIAWKGGRWLELAPPEKRRALKKEDRRGHRSERRRVPAGKRKRSKQV